MSSSSAVLSSVLPPEQEPVNMAESHIQRYKRLRYPEDAVLMDSRSSSSCSSPNEKASSKLRAYRLNIERPFNILNEQSPLEYGDYMKLWDGELNVLHDWGIPFMVITPVTRSRKGGTSAHCNIPFCS